MYCSRCGKKVLDSMLYCPFCGARIIIPEQEDGAEAALPEPVKVDPVFSFDIEQEPVKAPQPVEPEAEESVPEMTFPWEDLIADEEESGAEIPEAEIPESEMPEPEIAPSEVPAADIPETRTEEPAPERRQAASGNIVPGRRSEDTLVPDKPLMPDKASMFMDDEDDFDAGSDDFDDDVDDFDDFEEEVEREALRERARKRGKHYRDDDLEDDDDEDRGFVSRHIRGIVGILLFLILLAILAFYVLTDSGQMNLAKINATLPLRPDIYSRIAYDYYQSGDYAQSGVYYERALARDSGNYDFASSAVMAYTAAGDNDKAAEMLRKCIQLKPDEVMPYVYLLNLYPNANSRPWDVAQLLKQGYERTGDARLEATANGTDQG